MPAVKVELKSFGYGTKLIATFAIEHAHHVQRLLLLPTTDGIETSSGELFYGDRGQLLGLSEYDGTIGPQDVVLDFPNGVCIRAKLRTPISSQVKVKVTKHDTVEWWESLERVYRMPTDPCPPSDPGHGGFPPFGHSPWSGPMFSDSPFPVFGSSPFPVFTDVAVSLFASASNYTASGMETSTDKAHLTQPASLAKDSSIHRPFPIGCPGIFPSQQDGNPGILPSPSSRDGGNIPPRTLGRQGNDPRMVPTVMEGPHEYSNVYVDYLLGPCPFPSGKSHKRPPCCNPLIHNQPSFPQHPSEGQGYSRKDRVLLPLCCQV